MISKFLLAVLTASASAVSTPLSLKRFGCATESPSNEILAAAGDMQILEDTGEVSFARATIEVDTYFHVISAGHSVEQGNMPDSQVQDQLRVLNDAYAPHSIQFDLLGTTRTLNANWSSLGDELAMKQNLRRGDYSTLNVYFLNSVGGAYGFCYFPEYAFPGSLAFDIDGCVVLSHTAPGGSETGYNLGHTATHEVGHWFGLFHTFEGFSCGGLGDRVSDTPQSESQTEGCPIGRDSCPAVPGVDPINNFMDYSTDACYEEFTAGQRERMHNMWNTYRG